MSWELHRAVIVGGGMMGRSLATRVAQEGINVYLKEVSTEAVEVAKSELDRSLEHEIARFGLTNAEKKAILSRITWVTHYDCATDCDLALEAVQEDFGLKRQILRELDRRMPAENPIVITTSTLSITELATQNTHPERFVGMHFLYPVTTTRVVEVVRGQLTTDQVYERAIDFARLLGKVPIKVFEMPGFVTTRTILPLINEAIHIVMEGVAEAAEVDLALKMGFDLKRPRSTSPSRWASTFITARSSGPIVRASIGCSIGCSTSTMRAASHATGRAPCSSGWCGPVSSVPRPVAASSSMTKTGIESIACRMISQGWRRSL